jgi:hypothetical protein
MGESAAARFWSKVDKTGECWTWSARRDPDGYGVFWYEGKNRRAHRMAWLFTRGPDGMDGKLACHRCDNPSCVNPGHLFLGTNTDNLQDMARKGRSVGFDGEAHPMAKITAETVALIRGAYNSGESQSAIGARVGISQTQVSRIVRGKRWSHL